MPYTAMLTRTVLRGATALAVSAVAAFGLTTAAAAQAPQASVTVKPTVALSIPIWNVNSEKSFVVDYKFANLSKGSYLYLQRSPSFNYRYFNTVGRLFGTAHSVSVPGLGVGRYEYRVVDVVSGKTVATSATAVVRSYGNVTVSTLCQSSDAGYCDSGSVDIGSHVFEYALRDPEAFPGDEFFDFPTNTCRSMSLNFGIGNDEYEGPGDVETAAIDQVTRDEVRASAPYGSVGTVSTPLDSRPFQINLSETGDTAPAVYGNGYASCYSLTGR